MQLTKAMSLTFLCATLAFSQNRPLRSVNLSDMDLKENPCDDFFDYANRAWRINNPIPASMVRWSRRWAAGESTKVVLREILEDAAAKSSSESQDPTERLIGGYYSSCINEDVIEKQGIAPLRSDLERINVIKSVAELQRVITHLHKQAIFVPFRFRSSQDRHNPTQVIGEIVSDGLGLPDREYYFKEDDKSLETRQKYLQHVAATFELAGWDKYGAEKAAQTVMGMEADLAGAVLTNVERRDPYKRDHPMKVEGVQELMPTFQWKQYLQQMNLSPNIGINVQEPKFLHEVERQLNQTPLADWKIYLLWHLLKSASPSLSAAFVQEDFAFYNQYLNGAKEMKPRWKRCVESTDSNLGEALGKKYVEEKFPSEAKARVQEIVANILLVLRADLEANWMSDETKQRALAKLATVNPKVGYPDKWKNYGSVKIYRDSYLRNLIEAREFAVRDDLNNIGKPVDRAKWEITTPTSDAYYDPLLNEIVIPAGILLPPLFDVNAIDAVNYGGIGPIIGHEISHGFDDQGAKYDASGKLEDWWIEVDSQEFKRRTQCVAQQFDNYTIEGGMHLNGKLVLGESIADLAGVKLAFQAFQKSLKGNPRPPDKDGFTPEQQFFIAWGQARGDAVRPEAQRQMVLTDPHPIGKYRVIGPLSNLPEFQKAFSCKAGDPMARPPAQRCEIW